MSAITKPAQLLLRLREKDSANGVSRRTIARLAEELDLSETQVIHVALRRLAREVLPTYEPDEGPLTAEQHAAIAKAAPRRKGRSVRSSLF